MTRVGEANRKGVSAMRAIGDKRSCIIVLAVLVLLGSAQLLPSRDATPSKNVQVLQAQPRSLPSLSQGGERDSVALRWFGYDANADGYADEGQVWTFDHGAGMEGWTVEDLSIPPCTEGWRRIYEPDWTNGGNTVPLPTINESDGSYWAGLYENEADALGWVEGLGYGNDWNARARSPEFNYSGTGSVDLSFDYWVDLENSYDFLRVILSVPSESYEMTLNSPGFTGQSGTPTSPVHYSYEITELAGLAGGAPMDFYIIFELYSDGSCSDEDGGMFPPCGTDDGPFCVDNIQLENNLVGGNVSHDFEVTDHGYTIVCGGGVGEFVGINDFGNYTIPVDSCSLSVNVLEMHGEEPAYHPDGQHEMVYSPPVDLTAISGGAQGIIAEYDLYNDHIDDGVYYRPGWSYYDGAEWSERVGDDWWYYVYEPRCLRCVDEGSYYIPWYAQEVRFILELWSNCTVFEVPPEECTGMTHFGPLFDNIQIGVLASTGAGPVKARPPSFEIYPSFPNPFNPAATISYALREPTEVSIGMYDISGRLVRVLVDREYQQAGQREVIWDGLDENGNRAGSGVYFYRLKAGEQIASKRMVLLK